MVQGGRWTPSLLHLGPSCTSFQSPNAAGQEMNPVKVLRPGSTESLKSKDMSCSTMWHCQDIPASQRQQKLLTLQSGKGKGSPSSLIEKKFRKRLKLLSASSSQARLHPSSSLTVPEQQLSSLVSALNEAQQEGKQHHSSQQHEEMWVWVRVQGNPKSFRHCWPHRGCAEDLQHITTLVSVDSIMEPLRGRAVQVPALPFWGKEQPPALLCFPLW